MTAAAPSIPAAGTSAGCPELAPDTDVIRSFLQVITDRWAELEQDVRLEIRLVGDGPPVGRQFMPDAEGVEKAVAYAVEVNTDQQRNVYAVINPVRPQGGAASDNDVVASFFCWADADDEAGLAGIKGASIKPGMVITTGTAPHDRLHAYWPLVEPCFDLKVWRETQRAIATSLRTDRAVINPSSLMRVPGTVSRPNSKKRNERGYTDELVTAAITSELYPMHLNALTHAFPPRETLNDPTDKLFENKTDSRSVDEIIEAMRNRPSGERFEFLMTGSLLDIFGEYKNDRSAAIHGLAYYICQETWDEFKALAVFRRSPLWDDNRKGYRGRFDEYLLNNSFRKHWSKRAANEAPDGSLIKHIENLRIEMRDKVAGVGRGGGYFRPFILPADEDLPQRRWIYGHHYIRGYVSVLASPGGVGKTSMQIVEAIAICTRRNLLGDDVREKTNVAVVNLEDPMDEMILRTAAVCQHYGISQRDIAGRLYISAGRDIHLKFATQTRDGIIPNEALVEHLIKEIREKDLGVVLIDPFVSAHGVNENDNMAISAVVDQLRFLAEATGCSIGLVHHTRKGNGTEADVDSVRGAGSLIGAARAVRVINRMTKAEASKYQIPEEDRRLLFRVDDGKNNMSPPADKTVWRKMVNVQLWNGRRHEHVGVATNYELPDIAGSVGSTDLLRVQQAIAESEEPLKAHHNAKNWVGYTIAAALDIGITDKGPRQRVLALIKEWIDMGFLVEVERKEGRTGRKPKCIEVGKWAETEE